MTKSLSSSVNKVDQFDSINSFNTIKSDANQKVMSAPVRGYDCVYLIFDIYQQSCSTITAGDGKGVTTCQWKLVGSFEVLACPSSGGNAAPVYTPHGAGGGNSSGTNTTSTTAPSEQSVKTAIENNPFAFLTDVDCELVKKWLSTAKFTPDGSIINKLNTLTSQIPSYASPFQPQRATASIQKLDDAYSTVVNMDYFSVNITSLPVVNGKRLTAD